MLSTKKINILNKAFIFSMVTASMGWADGETSGVPTAGAVKASSSSKETGTTKSSKANSSTAKSDNKKQSKMSYEKSAMFFEHKAAVKKLEAKHAEEYRAAPAEKQPAIKLQHQKDLNQLNNKLKNEINTMNKKSEVQTPPSVKPVSSSVMKGVGKK